MDYFKAIPERYGFLLAMLFVTLVIAVSVVPTGFIVRTEIEDKTAPQINMLYHLPRNPLVGQKVTISARVSDPSGVSIVTFFVDEAPRVSSCFSAGTTSKICACKNINLVGGWHSYRLYVEDNLGNGRWYNPIPLYVTAPR